MRVFIPSMGRSHDILSGPLADMDRSLVDEYRVTYVVPEEESEQYREALKNNGVWVHSVGVEGIAQTRQAIGELAQSFGEQTFLMLDDDVRFLVRRAPDTWRLRGTEPCEVRDCLEMVQRCLEDGYGHVGISAREGNNRIGVGGPTLRAENTRTLRALAYRTRDFLSVEHGRVEVMEDFDVNLQLLERDIPNCSLHYWAQGQKQTNAPGGCSTYRSRELHERSAHRLAELHPGLVRLRQKENKTDRDGFGTRTEVTISWKKAYDQ